MVVRSVTNVEGIEVLDERKWWQVTYQQTWRARTFSLIAVALLVCAYWVYRSIVQDPERATDFMMWTAGAVAGSIALAGALIHLGSINRLTNAIDNARHYAEANPHSEALAVKWQGGPRQPTRGNAIQILVGDDDGLIIVAGTSYDTQLYEVAWSQIRQVVLSRATELWFYSGTAVEFRYQGASEDGRLKTLGPMRFASSSSGAYLTDNATAELVRRWLAQWA